MYTQIKLMISSVFHVVCFKPRGPPLIPLHPKKQSICKTPLGNIKFRMHRSQDRTRSQMRTRYSRIAGPGGVAGSPPPLRIMQPLNRNLSRQADQQEVFYKSCRFLLSQKARELSQCVDTVRSAPWILPSHVSLTFNTTSHL